MDAGSIPKRKKTMGIRVKLIALIIPIFLVLTVLFFVLSRTVIIRLSQDKLTARSEVSAGNVSVWAQQILSELQLYQDTIESGDLPNDDAILKYMEVSLDRNSAYPNGLYIGDDSGIYLDPTGWVPGDDWILVERDWYVEGKGFEKVAFGEPYYDAQTGDMCVSASVHMKYDKAVRVMAADIYLDYVCEMMKELDKGDKGRTFLVTQNSQTVLAHPNTDMMAVTLDTKGIDKLYAGVGAAIGKGQKGMLSLKGDHGNYYVCIHEIPDTDWMLVSYQSENDVLAGLRRLEAIMLVVAALSAAILIAVTFYLMNGVVKPVAKVTDVIRKVSDGDFSQNIEVKGNDEVGVMSAHTQNFLVQMRKTISDITDIAKWLERQSEENDNVAGSLTDSSGSQMAAMKVLNERAHELSRAASEAFSQMEELAKVIAEADKQGKDAGEMMRQTAEIAENGKAGAESVSNGMNHIKDSISALSGQIMETAAAVGQIGNMVDMIISIAEETNLLSLNASIEAARAGESGRGFAVVAEQIGKLAVNSAEATDKISKLTADIQTEMHEAIEKMEESAAEVSANAGLVSQNRENFDIVCGKVLEADRMVDRMVELVGRTEEVSANMKKIAENQLMEADQITEAAKELDDHTRTVSEGSSTVAQNAKELERESKNLMKQVGRFRI